MIADDSMDVAVGVFDDKVVLKFPHPIEHIALDGQNSIDIARAMTDAAMELRDGVKPVGDTLKAELIDRHRDTLIPRINMLLGTQRENRVITNGRLSMQIIDIVFSEIFS